MIPPRVYNTKERGTIEFVVYREENTYVGVCLSFDIVEEGADSVALMESIKEAAKLHLQAVRDNNLSDDLLNRYAPEEYWDKYLQVIETLKDTKANESESNLVVSPYYQTPARELTA